MAFLDKLKFGLKKTKESLFGGLGELFGISREIDDDFYDELEETLICADIGFEVACEITDSLRERIKAEHIKTQADAYAALKEIISSMIGEGEPLNLDGEMAVVLIIGVNGAGKTTSIGKISNKLIKDGKKVVVAAADTFRAAAIDQLAVWCERSGAQIIKHSEGSDPAAVVYDAISYSKNKKADVLIIDTAGRLHNKKNLMDELAKINRVIDRELPGATRENLLVLDATTGQNAILQAKEFKNAASITGLVLNKLDGTAKGGIILSIKKELGIPVKFVGVGEKINDMQPFNAKEFSEALFAKDDGDENADVEDAE
jgi:fused signal recognition particle receptor